MSVLAKLFSRGEREREINSQQEKIQKLAEGEELLMKKKEFLKAKINQQLLFAKRNSRKNRRVALQALRRTKWYEKHLKDIDCAVKVMRSAHEYIDFVNKVDGLIKDITEEQEDMSDTLHTSVSFGVQFDEDELLAELERLEKIPDEGLFEQDRTEERIIGPKVSSTASPSQPAKTEEDEIEGDLEYLRRWASEPSQRQHQPQYTGIKY